MGQSLSAIFTARLANGDIISGFGCPDCRCLGLDREAHIGAKGIFSRLLFICKRVASKTHVTIRIRPCNFVGVVTGTGSREVIMPMSWMSARCTLYGDGDRGRLCNKRSSGGSVEEGSVRIVVAPTGDSGLGHRGAVKSVSGSENASSSAPEW